MSLPNTLFSLTDSQLTVVMSLLRPLQPPERTALLAMLAAKLDGVEWGDGQLYRLLRELQRANFTPPEFTSGAWGHSGKEKPGRPKRAVA